MKIEFENSIRRLRFLCRLPDTNIAWINPWMFPIAEFKKNVASFRLLRHFL